MCYFKFKKNETRLKEKRLRSEVEGKLQEEQAVSRQKKQWTDNLCMLRNIIERKDHYMSLYVRIIDLKTAFVSIDRIKIWEVMQKLRNPSK